ncbi:MAG: hypothetical protein OXI60_11890 [Acidiferrobacterales bacterium]|nr:hypothetical protein [Acidiferrobacterales bacterium]
MEYQLRVQEAQSQLKLAEINSSGSHADLAHLDYLQARLELAQFNLEQTELSLPYELQVARGGVDVGELVGPAEYVGREAAVLGVGYRREAIQVSATVEPELLENTDPLIGASAKVTVGEKVFETTVYRVSSLVRPETRLVPIFLELPAEAVNDPFLLPGMFAEIELEGPTHDNVFVLPYSTVQSNDKVWTVNDGALSVVQPVSVGHTESGWVVEAFDTADGIVNGPVPGRSEGFKVQIQN